MDRLVFTIIRREYRSFGGFRLNYSCHKMIKVQSAHLFRCDFRNVYLITNFTESSC